MKLKKADKNDMRLIKKLYRRSFPFNERAPFFLLKKRAEEGKAQIMTAVQDGGFAGFAYTVSLEKCVYLFYLAVPEEKQGKGYGSRILGIIKKYYGDKCVFLAREQLDPNAENYSQRLRRHSFYLKNGFSDIPLCIREGGVVYDVMSCGGSIAKKDYDLLMEKWAGKLLGRLVKMEAMEKQS